MQCTCRIGRIGLDSLMRAGALPAVATEPCLRQYVVLEVERRFVQHRRRRVLAIRAEGERLHDIIQVVSHRTTGDRQVASAVSLHPGRPDTVDVGMMDPEHRIIRRGVLRHTSASRACRVISGKDAANIDMHDVVHLASQPRAVGPSIHILRCRIAEVAALSTPALQRVPEALGRIRRAVPWCGIIDGNV